METEDKYFLWGEIPGSDTSSINLTPSEKEALLKISRPLTDQIDGPKFHSPLTTMKEMKMEPQTDPLVTNTIQLLEYKRVCPDTLLDQLLDLRTVCLVFRKLLLTVQTLSLRRLGCFIHALIDPGLPLSLDKSNCFCFALVSLTSVTDLVCFMQL